VNTTESYTYDPVGNRLSSLGVSPYAYNTSNELTSTPSTTYTFDNNGNTTSKTDSTGTTQYTRDFENRLSSVTLPGTGGTVSFAYDPFGRRIKKVSSAGTSIFAYDGDNLIEETNSSGGVVARYSQTQNLDEPLAMLRNATTSYYHADGLGSVTSLSSAAGSIANTYTYDSFGKLTNSTGSLVNPFRYTARESDTETGLYYYRARYYDSSAGRFVSEDSVRFDANDANFYRYVKNGPADFADPSGNTIVPVLGSGANAGLNLTDYYTALKYLNSDPACAGVIKRLERSPRVFLLEFNSSHDDSYDPDTRAIHWDPYSAWCCPEGGRQTPALGLCHEMAHAAGDGPVARHMTLTPDIQYDNREERRVIRTYETPFAIRKQECVRHSHAGGPEHVPTPVSK